MRIRILFYLFSFVFILQSAVYACEACEAQQPKYLRGITHGTGPQGNSDYIIIAAAALLVLFTLVYAVKFLAKPGERNNDHIKRTILQETHHGI